DSKKIELKQRLARSTVRTRGFLMSDSVRLDVRLGEFRPAAGTWRVGPAQRLLARVDIRVRNRYLQAPPPEGPLHLALMPGSELSIVVPTYNEAGNILPFVDRVAAAMNGVDWELVFVDDNSPDGTAAVVHKLSRTNDRVRLVLRLADRGL